MSFRWFVSRSKHMIHHCRVQVTKLRLLCFNREIERLILIITDIFQIRMSRLPWTPGIEMSSKVISPWNPCASNNTVFCQHYIELCKKCNETHEKTHHRKQEVSCHNEGWVSPVVLAQSSLGRTDLQPGATKDGWTFIIRTNQTLLALPMLDWRKTGCGWWRKKKNQEYLPGFWRELLSGYDIICSDNRG